MQSRASHHLNTRKSLTNNLLHNPPRRRRLVVVIQGRSISLLLVSVAGNKNT
jgi:hypothetical protein